MTTVAYDGRSLAADRQISCDGTVYRSAKKIHEIDGSLIACCGSVGQINHFLKWFKAGRKKKAPDLDEFGAIEITKGRAYTWEGDSRIELGADDKVAIGSGWCWAASAMDFGKTAAEAVQYASTRDNGTGYGVDFVEIRKRQGAKNRGR